jgi:hypothetical protein
MGFEQNAQIPTLYKTLCQLAILSIFLQDDRLASLATLIFLLYLTTMWPLVICSRLGVAGYASG